MNILIVDDQEENLYLLETLLKKSGYVVESAMDGAKALEKLRANGFDMIISDVLMPVMDGFQLCKEVKKDDTLRNIPFIFCTATYTDEKDEELAYKMGAAKYIHKPIDTDELIKIVQDVIRDAKRGKIRGKKPVLKEEKEVFKLYSERLVKKLEERTLALDKSERKYRRICENVNDLVFSLDEGGYFTAANCRVDLFGYLPKDVIGKHFTEFLTPGSRDTILRYFEKTKKSINTQDIHEIEIAKKDGIIAFAELNMSIVYENDKFHGRFGIARDITERKRAEEALKETEKMIRTILDSLAFGVSLINSGMEIVWLNKTFRKRFPDIDIERRPACYKSFYRPLKEGICSYCPTVKSFEDGRVHSAETGVCVDGNIYLITAAPILDKNGRTTLVIETVVDITERKIVEGTIRESEERYRDLFDNVNDGIVTIDTTGDITYFNEKFAQLGGYLAEELVGKNIADIIHPDDRKFVLDRHKRRQMGENVPSIYDFKGLKKNGETIYVEANASVIKSGKKVLGSRVILRDITERKQVEKALRESEERYRMLFENANDAIFIADARTERLLFVNKMAEKLIGRNRKELIGMHRSKLHPKEKAAYYKKQFRDHIDSGSVIDEEAEVERKDSTIVPVLISASVFEIEDRKIIQGIFRDITERKKAEDDLLRKFLRYRVEKGEVYLIKERNPDLSIEVFKDVLNCGFLGTVFSRTKREEIEETFGKARSFWFAEKSRAKDAIKPRFSEVKSRIKALGSGNNVVLLDRIDYLISKNGFDATLEFVQELFEQAYHQKLIVILSLDPKTLDSKELRQLEKETKRVEPKVKSRIPEDIYEILKFVYAENRIGVYPSYKNVYEKFKITRTTARNRIKRLRAMKFLVDKKRGRTKVLEVTDEGHEQF